MTDHPMQVYQTYRREIIARMRDAGYSVEEPSENPLDPVIVEDRSVLIKATTAQWHYGTDHKAWRWRLRPDSPPDFYILYAAPIDVAFVVPAEEVVGQIHAVITYPLKSTHWHRGLQKYANRWDLLGLDEEKMNDLQLHP